jgi:hypothetical protein
MSVCVCALAFLCAGGWGRPCPVCCCVSRRFSRLALVLAELEARRIALAYLHRLDF